MTPNQKLNYVLHKWDKVPALTWEGLKVEMDKDPNFKLFKQDPKYHELFLIVEKLIRDKYVEALDQTAGGDMQYVTTTEIKNSTYLRRNFDGTVFIKNGGYVSKERWRITNKAATILNIVLLLVIGFFQVKGCGSSSSNKCSDKCDTIQLVKSVKDSSQHLTSKSIQILPVKEKDSSQ